MSKYRRVSRFQQMAGLLAVFLVISATQSQAVEPLEIPPELAEVLSQRYPRGVEDLKLLEAQVQQVADRAVAATVGVEIGRNIGSGVIVSREGLILTAAHVIGRHNRPATIVLSDGRQLSGKTLGAHYPLDTGMVQITEVPDDLPYIPVSEEDAQPALGEWVVATGQPGGTLNDRSPPVRLGRVLAAHEHWICTDCTLVGGDSGGPLLNISGEVVALHMSIGPSISHNFHVPVSLIRQYWDQMMAGQMWGHEATPQASDMERALLGLAGRTENGRCVITQVFPGFPAETAGIRTGDVILRVADAEVDTFAELARQVLEKQPGDSIHLQILRNTETLEMEVPLIGATEPLPGSFRSAPAETEEDPS